jgi:hypothetical protein
MRAAVLHMYGAPPACGGLGHWNPYDGCVVGEAKPSRRERARRGSALRVNVLGLVRGPVVAW